MKTVLEACKPKKGIVEGSLNLEIFTASLGPVIDYYHHNGGSNTDSIYTDAEFFFRDATYPTNGLKEVLGGVFRRVSGDGAVPSIYRLETAFGGGKTHSLISCLHIAYRGKELRNVTKDIIDEELLPEPGTVSVVGIAGDELEIHQTQGDEIKPYTIWGEMAYQIGGEDLYQKVKSEAESYASPGKSFFETVLGERKIIIMLDEIAQYAARLEVALPDQGANQLSAFLMSLNGYAKNHLGISIIITLASASDAFAKQTEQLAKKLNEIQANDKMTASDAAALMDRTTNSVLSVVSREATVKTPVQANEISLILAKRLFESIDVDAAKEVVSSYMTMYQRNESLLPEEANTMNFAQRMLANYPFHPKFIDFLNQKLALAENFQGTRGVLRVLALTIRAIWQKQKPVMMIHTSNIDMRNAATVDEILGKTGSADLKVALNTDIGSVDTKDLVNGMSQAQRVDQKNPHPDEIPMYELTWKTVFLNSLVGRAEGKSSRLFGINQSDAIFMISNPILTPAQVKIALEEINKSAFYLRCEDGKYFAHQDPTLNSVLALIRMNVDEKKVHQKLKSLADSMIQDNHLFHVEQDVHLPQDIPDNTDKPIVAVMGLDVDQVAPLDYFTTKGDNAPRINQNMQVLLIPETVSVSLPNTNDDMFHGLDPVKQKSRSHIEDLARQVIAYGILKDNPQAYGINPGKLNDADFVEKSRERAMALNTRVAELYNKLYFSYGGQNVEVRELRATAGDSGATILNQIAQELIKAGKLIWQENDKFKATDLTSLAKQFFFANNDRAVVLDLQKSFQCYRSWPMLSSKAVFDKLLREGVAGGCWAIYRMGTSGESEMPEEIYTQEKPVNMNINLLTNGYSVMTLEGAKKRHWLEKDRVPQEQIKAELINVLQSSGAATVQNLTEAVQAKYANATEEQVKDSVKEVVKTAGVSAYEGTVDQQEKPQTQISSFEAPFHEFKKDDVIITKSEESERGWLQQQGLTGLMAGLSPNEKAQKLFPLLKNMSSWYNRGKAKTDIKYMDISDLRLPSGARMRISFDDLTPMDIRKLDEFFEILTSVAQVSDNTDGEIELEDISDDEDVLIQELKKK